ncbi:hypothetical protein JCM10207_008148 [Rhodosporidiobolus poonsookiae]
MPATLRNLVERHIASGLSAAEEAETHRDPWAESTKYAHASVIFLCTVIALFGLKNLTSTLLSRRASSPHSSPALRRGVAFYRWLEASQPGALGWLRFAPYGSILIIAGFWLFTLIWTLAVQPYYHSRWDVGSPPIAVRAGMFALGCFPFILALGTKWNIVGFVVGVSHEKLQIYHQWLSHLFLLLSLVHAFPFIVQGGNELHPNDDGSNPEGLSQLMFAWKKRGMVYYWSGIAALVPLAWLCWGALPFIRNRLYQVSRLLHIVSAILFSAFFYIHCNELLTSWRYLWATAAVYFTSFVARALFVAVRNGRHLPTGTVEALPAGAVRVTAALPEGAGYKWKAGQHYYVNFLKARSFDNRPYLVTGKTSSSLSVLVPTSTPVGARLLALAESAVPTTPLLLDGPYGGLLNRDFSRHNRVVLLADGRGMSFVPSVAEDLVDKALAGGKRTVVEVHWNVASAEMTSWFEEQLTSLVQRLDAAGKRDLLSLNLYTASSSAISLVRTGSGSQVSTLVGAEEEKLDKVENSEAASTSTSSIWTFHAANASASSILEAAFAPSSGAASVGVAVCGSDDLARKMRRAVAKKQKQLAFGEAGEGVQEVELHVEEEK